MGKVLCVAQQKGGSGKTTIAANLAVEFRRRGLKVALLDTDPQGSLGRWFMARRQRLGEAGMEFSTASAWGVGYECEKLKKVADIVIVDTPPKVDADLRPALREAGLGTMWGEERARAMLADAGFGEVSVHALPHDIQNYYYLVKP